MPETDITGFSYPHASSELNFDELENSEFITYKRALDKQLCQYIGIVPDQNFKSDAQSQIINKILSLNIFSLTGKTYKINSSLVCDQKLEAKHTLNGFIFLHTQTANDRDILEIQETTGKTSKFHYAVCDLLLTKKNVLVNLRKPQPVIVFEAEECLDDSWIEYIKLISFDVKPTR